MMIVTLTNSTSSKSKAPGTTQAASSERAAVICGGKVKLSRARFYSANGETKQLVQ
jgi:hypothetical protein